MFDDIIGLKLTLYFKIISFFEEYLLKIEFYLVFNNINKSETGRKTLLLKEVFFYCLILRHLHW
jgi:hypothetical protein